MSSQKRFTTEYKEEIIKLVTEQGKKATHVARDIGVSEATVRGWVKKYKEHGINAFPGSGKLRAEDQEIRELKKKIADIEEENAILKKSYTHLHKAREVKCKFINKNSSIFHVEKMCKVLDIKRSSYYAWLKRKPSKRSKNDLKLVSEIKRIHKESYNTYGVRRIKAKLDLEGFHCGKNKVSRLMKEHGVHSKITRKFKATTYSNHNFNVAPNLLK